jgi:DNA-binding transcriptional LysR family regulator
LVTIRETGIVLGSLLLEEEEWRTMRLEPVLSLRIDDHPETDGWTTRHPDGTESHVVFDIPMVPVAVPAEALAHSRALEEWVMDTHGATGRLLVWAESRRWWMTHEPDLELVVTCAPLGLFADESEESSWWSLGTAKGREAVEALAARYGVTWDG